MNKTPKHMVNGLPCTNDLCWCKKEDVVNNPEHYQLNGLEVEALDVIQASLNEEEFKGYLMGNMIKYLLRHKKKNNEEDIQKMLFYSKRLDKCM